MDLTTWRVLMTGLWLLSACGDDAVGDPSMMPSPQGTTTPSSSAQADGGGANTLNSGPATGGGDSAFPALSNGDAGSASATSDVGVAASDAKVGQSDAGTAAAEAGQPVTQQPYDYMMQEVALSADLVIPKDKTVRVGPGVKFTAKSNIKVDVQGTLVVEGSAAAPSSFLGNGQSESWQGIVVASGASLMLDHATISGAKYGFHALAGSTFSVDNSVFDTSFKGAVLQANGTISHSVFKAELLFPALTEGVSIDDPNGFLTIIEASPTISNCRFDGSGGLNDMVRIGGNASPKFDHCNVNNSHCGFHTNGGTNSSARITNTIFENLSYGIMAYTTKPIVENSVFRRNGSDIGVCDGATTANAPGLMGNFYEGGAVKLDANCDKIGTKDASPATTANASAGPSGL
jgi:hypothetical protein